MRIKKNQNIFLLGKNIKNCGFYLRTLHPGNFFYRKDDNLTPLCCNETRIIWIKLSLGKSVHCTFDFGHFLRENILISPRNDHPTLCESRQITNQVSFEGTLVAIRSVIQLNCYLCINGIVLHSSLANFC